MEGLRPYPLYSVIGRAYPKLFTLNFSFFHSFLSVYNYNYTPIFNKFMNCREINCYIMPQIMNNYLTENLKTVQEQNF